MYAPVLVVFIVLLGLTKSMVSTISASCEGQYEYRDDAGQCRLCEICAVGYGPVEGQLCGYGNRTPDFGCEICKPGYYSDREDNEECIQCHPCETDWHSYTKIECSPKSNSVCGSCHEGYFRLIKSKGQWEDICLPCESAPEGTPECREKGDSVWVVIGPVMSVIAGVFLLVIVVVLTLWCKSSRRRKKKYQRGASPSNDSLLELSFPENSSQSLGDSRAELEAKQFESEIPKPSYPAVSSHICETRFPGKDEATVPFTASIHSPNLLTPFSNYSDMPTAQFAESNYHDNQSPSNMPTGLYDDAHPSQVIHVNQNQTVMMSQRQNRRKDLTSSNENLLDNADRDSRLVDDRHTPDNHFEPDSFDTRSYSSESTKPHKVASNLL